MQILIINLHCQFLNSIINNFKSQNFNYFTFLQIAKLISKTHNKSFFLYFYKFQVYFINLSFFSFLILTLLIFLKSHFPKSCFLIYTLNQINIINICLKL